MFKTHGHSISWSAGVPQRGYTAGATGAIWRAQLANPAVDAVLPGLAFVEHPVSRIRELQGHVLGGVTQWRRV
jgi:hypothetical protein